MLRGGLPIIAAAATLAAALPGQADANAQSGVMPSASAVSAAPVRVSAGQATVYLPDAFFVHHVAVTVPRRWFHVVGIVRPWVAGQPVTLKLFLGRRLVKKMRVELSPSSNHSYGHFRVALRAPGSGWLEVSIARDGSSQSGGFTAQRGLAALDERAGFGSTGRFVALIQQRLAALHFYIRQTGVYDQGTGLAIDAYHRLLHWGTSQTLDGRTISFLLDGFGGFRVRFPSHGRHAEGNLSLQLLALAEGATVQAIYPISSGKPSTPTILGDFRVYSKVPGYLPDGMYYSNFFYGEYAIHGYDPAPDYPASHGCMRLPIADATSVYGWLGIGDWVDVYY
jgi:hypothetical protein